MSFGLTARLPLSRHAVDRNHVRRAQPGLLEALWADAATRVLVLSRGRALLQTAPTDDPAAAPKLALLAPAALGDVEVDPGTLLYLGLSLDESATEPAGTSLVSVVLSDDAAHTLEPDESRWVILRDIATTASDRDAGVFAEALAVANWHRSHTHCPRCGAATVVEDAGWTRRCPVDGGQVFPRTDPAVIVLITDDADRILLGSNAMWEHNRYSLLAGFAEPGESLEAAVIREMFEESGLRVTDPVYLGSQPWPFPASLMVGFAARVADGQDPQALLPDGEEILDLRWFSRAELLSERDVIMLPGASSIARAMIEHWLGEPLEPTGAAR
ncbi:NAD(+) diphosphatase [Leifsonia sp. A12D58]|uniref:NAD(+) diphosphatase n=1 Tax=Leifsonia sp. A12D58 TaxID=3397674 RepID=UPI0039E198CF